MYEKVIERGGFVVVIGVVSGVGLVVVKCFL